MVKRFEDDSGVGFASSLDAEHVECVCKALENTANIDQLACFLDTFPTSTFTGTSPPTRHADEKRNNGARRRLSAVADADSDESLAERRVTCRDALRRAKALVLFHQRRFDAFYAYVASTHFAADHHTFLQRLWNEAHYMETELQRGKKLDPVSRYRVRKKNAFPRTIWDGEGTSYCFKKSARTTLRQWYAKEQTPSQERKRELARLTKLSVVQVSNWFKNQRQRARQYQREGRSTNNSCCSGYSSAVESEPEADEDDAEVAASFVATANERAASSDEDNANTNDDAVDSSNTLGVGVDASSLPPHYSVFSEPDEPEVSLSSSGVPAFSAKPSYNVSYASSGDHAPPPYYYGSHHCNGGATTAMYAAAAAAAAAAATAQMYCGGATEFYQFRHTGYGMSPPYYYCPPSLQDNPPLMTGAGYGYPMGRPPGRDSGNPVTRSNVDAAQPTAFPPAPNLLHSTDFSATFLNNNNSTTTIDNNVVMNTSLKYHSL